MAVFSSISLSTSFLLFVGIPLLGLSFPSPFHALPSGLPMRRPSGPGSLLFFSSAQEVALPVQEQRPSLLPTLTASDFHSFLQGNAIVFVLFFAPWCYWSRLALPEFAAAASLLSHHDPAIRLARIDTSEHQDIARMEGIREYPTLRLYLNNNTAPFVPFAGNRHRAQFVHWIDSHLQRDKTLSSVAHLDELLQPHHEQIVVIAVFPENVSAQTDDGFMWVAREFGDNIIFAHTNSTPIRAHLEDKHIRPILNSLIIERVPADFSLSAASPSSPSSSYIALFTPFPKEDGLHLYTGSLQDKEAIREFVRRYEFPAVVPFTPLQASRVFQDGRPLCVFISDSSDNLVQSAEAPPNSAEAKHDGNKKLEDHEKRKARQLRATEDPFRKIAQMNRGKFLFATSGTTESHEKRLMALAGVEDDAVPSVRILTFNPHGDGHFHPALKYRPDDTPGLPPVASPEMLLDESVLHRFLQAYEKGQVKAYLKSESVPNETENAGPVRIVVGQSFEAEVKQNKKEVFIVFYAPWCGHCRKLEPALKELALRLRPVSSLVVSKMDATRNEVDGLIFGGFPTLLFYGSNKTQLPRAYEGERSVRNMLNWILERSSEKFDVNELMSRSLSEQQDPQVAPNGDLVLEEL